MELLILIHHPHTKPRPLKELLIEVAGTYDRALGSPSERQSLALSHSSILMLRWPAVDLGWPSWYPDDKGTLVTAGMPLLYAPPGDRSEMLRPDRLAALIRAGAAGPSSDLGYCGG